MIARRLPAPPCPGLPALRPASPAAPSCRARAEARSVGALRVVSWLLGWALACLPGSLGAAWPGEAGDELPALRRLVRDPSPSARASAYRRLAGNASPEALGLLLQGLQDPHPYVRRASAGVLGTLDDARARQRLAAEVPRWRSELARLEACQAFALWLDPAGEAGLRAAARDPAPAVRCEALRWLADDPRPEAGELLRAATADRDGAVRAEAWAAWVPRGPAEAGTGLGPGHEVPPAQPALADADARVRLAALEVLVAQGGSAAAAAVVHALADPSWSVRRVAAGVAARVRSRVLLAPLVGALEDVRSCVVDAAGASLVALTGIPFDSEPGPWRTWLAQDGRDFDPAQAAEGAGARPAPLPVALRTQEARFLGLTVRSRHVAFVLDASGSMGALTRDGRTRWAAVVEELERCLAALQGAHVNLAVFHDRVEAALPRALPLDGVRRDALMRFVRAREPAGRTALYDGIAWGLSDPEVDSVVVLSDGAPSAGQWFTKTDLRAELARANRFRRARIDVVAAGVEDVARRWRDALEDVARDAGGTYVARAASAPAAAGR